MKKLVYTLFSGWLYLSAAAQQQPVLQTGHFGSFCMALSPDDQKLVTAGVDGRIMLWDLSSAKAVQNFKPVNAPVYCAAWNKDGSRFAIGTSNSMIIFYDGQTAKEIRRMKAPFPVVKICFNPKHDVVAIGGNDGNVKVLNETTGDVYFSFKPDDFITGLCFSSNGALLFASGWNNGVSAYEMNQGKKMLSQPTADKVYTTGMQLSANDEFLFMHLQNGTTEIVNLFQSKNAGSLNNTPYYQDRDGTFYLEPVITADNLFILTVDKDNNLVASHQKNNLAITYNNSFSQAKVATLLPSHNGQFFVMADDRGSISSVYFNEQLFKSESPLLWRKLQASPERIYRVDFLNHDETLALTGKGYYQFNMATGDMHRRDQDSAVVSDREYTARYFMTDQNSGVYYYTDLLRNTGYAIQGSEQRPLAAVAFSNDTSTVAFVDADKKLVVYHLKERKKYLERKMENEVLFSGSIHDLFVCNKGNQLSFINTKGETVQTIVADQEVASLCADAKLKKVYLLDNNQHLQCYDFATAKPISLPGELAGIKSGQMMEVSADGKNLAVFDGEHVCFYRTSDGKKIFDINASDDLPYAFSFNQKGNRMAIAQENGITTLWDIDQKQKIFNVLATPQDGMLVYTDEHYYMATREAARHMVFAQGNQYLSLANAELTYNRPDKVLEKTGISNPKIVNAYKYAYERRLKRNKLNLHSDHAEVPQVALLNQETLKASTAQEQVKLNFKASSAIKKLSYLQIWLNNVPVYGQQGLELEAKNETEKTIDLDLVSGTNHIKFSVVNEDGTESEKQEITLVNTQVTPPDLYLLTIGASQYKNAAFNLNYAAKDANDLATLFASLKGKDRPYGRIYTKTLVNETVTRENMKKTRDFLKQAKSNDIIMVFVAGHGVRDEEMHYFFGTHDMNFDRPGERGFSEEDFAQLTDGLKAVRKLIFFDTCLSGEMDKEEAEQTFASNVAAKNGDVSFRAAGAGIRTKTTGLNNASALMRTIYNDLDEGTGSTVISSAGGAEYAMESSEWKNGLFTYCFLNGLKNLAADQNGDKQITVNEIQDHVRKEVVRLSKGKQQPSFKTENLVMNYRIW